MKVTKGQKRILAVIAVILIWLLPASALAADLPFILPAAGEPASTEEPGVRRAVVLCDTNYRKMPSETAETTGRAGIGEALDIYAVNVNGAWDAVMDENRQMVYIHSSAVSISAPTYAKDDPSDIHVTEDVYKRQPSYAPTFLLHFYTSAHFRYR